MDCAYCKAVLPPSCKYCPECGKKVEPLGNTTTGDIVAVRSNVAIGTNSKAAGRDINEFTHISASSNLFVAPGKNWALPIRPRSQNELIEPTFISSTAHIKKEVFAPASLTIENDCQFEQSALATSECEAGDNCVFNLNLYLGKGGHIGNAAQIKGWVINPSAEKVGFGKGSNIRGIFSRGPVILEDASICHALLSEADVLLGRQCQIFEKLTGFNVHLGAHTKANQVIAQNNLVIEDGGEIQYCETAKHLTLTGNIAITGQRTICAGDISCVNEPHLHLMGSHIQKDNFFFLLPDGNLAPYDGTPAQSRTIVITSLLTHALLAQLGHHAPRFNNEHF